MSRIYIEDIDNLLREACEGHAKIFNSHIGDVKINTIRGFFDGKYVTIKRSDISKRKGTFRVRCNGGTVAYTVDKEGWVIDYVVTSDIKFPKIETVASGQYNLQSFLFEHSPSAIRRQDVYSAVCCTNHTNGRVKYQETHFSALLHTLPFDLQLDIIRRI